MNNNRVKGCSSMCKKGDSASQRETDLTEHDLDIFDQKIE
jgi:hypothetical protein